MPVTCNGRALLRSDLQKSIIAAIRQLPLDYCLAVRVFTVNFASLSAAAEKIR